MSGNGEVEFDAVGTQVERRVLTSSPGAASTEREANMVTDVGRTAARDGECA